MTAKINVPPDLRSVPSSRANVRVELGGQHFPRLVGYCPHNEPLPVLEAWRGRARGWFKGGVVVLLTKQP